MLIALIWFSGLIGLAALISDRMDRHSDIGRRGSVHRDFNAAHRPAGSNLQCFAQGDEVGTQEQEYDDAVRGVINQARVAQFVLNFEPQERVVAITVKNGRLYGTVEQKGSSHGKSTSAGA